MHVCFACDARNPDRSFEPAGGRACVPARFVGPPGSVNGGMATGLLACPALRAAASVDARAHAATRVTARLYRAAPVERDLDASVESVDAGWRVTLEGGGADVISGTVETRAFDEPPRAGDALAEPPVERGADVAELAALGVPDAPPFFDETGDHPIPGCFSCGPENGRGLHIYPRSAADGVTCAPWLPDPSFDDGGALATAVLTSAIDCSSGICMPLEMQRELLALDQFFLLGSLDVRYLRLAPSGLRYRVAAKALRRDGRKFFGLSVLAGEDGTPYAMAEATWIVAGISRTAAFGAQRA